MNYFQEQNERILNGTWTEKGETHLLHLDTLVLVNTCIDRYVQWPAYPRMMYNNTYGIKAINESTYEQVLDDIYRKGGCLDQIEACRNLSLIYDPTNQGLNASVNTLCAAAETFCSDQVLDPYFETPDFNYYDISAPSAASFPPPWMWGWVNQPHVQQGLGVPVNWTATSAASSKAFRSMGDYPRPGILEDLGHLLDSGIKVSMVYGDRDFACNWYGGELVSLAIPYAGKDSFAAAGYTDLVVNSSYVGGQVRQYGNLSFTRVYESGHEVAAYQPETAFKIFQRALFNLDVATGTINTACTPDYATEGPYDTYNITNEPIKDPGSQCYVLLPQQCTDEQWATVVDGSALVKDWIVVDANTTSLIAELSGNGTSHK
jgi:carboxypeptidase C (cathepsin A)